MVVVAREAPKSRRHHHQRQLIPGTEREKLKASMSSYSQSQSQWCNSDGASDPIAGKESYYPRSTTYSSSSITGATSVFCNCGVRAVKMTSYTKANPGRAFYRCPSWKNKRRSCGYFG
ncbi:hypothetical protein CRG98_005899 [Punica granatum]|uniref:GRF-type domain-containing protein n=1 Tax=Punica granatum TaxID=22663 RepID=A0A2I0KYV7_PUNGR|nr:hypothetical protein CRG98_005899 [Punica granatum]